MDVGGAKEITDLEKHFTEDKNKDLNPAEEEMTNIKLTQKSLLD